jgi:hypothetical protein
MLYIFLFLTCATNINIIFHIYSYYLSTPHLAYDCMLYTTKAELDLLSDIDKILFVENNLRGGMAYVSQRYCKAGKHRNTDTDNTFFTELLYIDGKSAFGGVFFF